MYLYLIIAFQGFCIYHLFKNRKSFYWIFAILFLPFIGCVTYLVTQVLNKRSAEQISGNLATVIEPSKKNASSGRIKDLEDQLDFADTYLNRINLAEAYLNANNYTKAIEHYQIALNDQTQNDFYVKANLIESFFHLKDFDQVLAYSDGLQDHKEYEKSKIPFYYGMALAENNKTEEAIAQFEILDKPYSNYNERLTFANFLVRLERNKDAKILVDELSVEMQNMTATNKQIFKATIHDVEKLKKSL